MPTERRGDLANREADQPIGAILRAQLIVVLLALLVACGRQQATPTGALPAATGVGCFGALRVKPASEAAAINVAEAETRARRR